MTTRNPALIGLAWHDVVSPEGSECRDRPLHAASQTIVNTGHLEQFLNRLAELEKPDEYDADEHSVYCTLDGGPVEHTQDIGGVQIDWNVGEIVGVEILNVSRVTIDGQPAEVPARGGMTLARRLSRLDPSGHIKVTDSDVCKSCLDTGYVCGNHPTAPWIPEVGVIPGACGCGAGTPCPTCCSPLPLDGTGSITLAFVPDKYRNRDGPTP